MSTIATPTPAAATDVLFEPLRLGGLTLRNRLVMAPMGTCLDAGGHITDDTIAYYVRRARGGVGTITVEGCLVSADTVGPEPRISGPEYLPGLRRLVDALRPYDVTVGVQLMHPGRQVVAGPVVAPSPVGLNSQAPLPHALTEGEIGGIVEDYARAARLAMAAGFAFVEVHGAHGYLPSNFLSPTDNRRTDGYGGDLAGRARFSLEIARAIVRAGGADLPSIWRINGDDALPGGFGIGDAGRVAHWLEGEGAAAISVTAGTWRSLQVTLAPMFVQRGHMLGLAAAVRRSVGIPVLAVGRLDDPGLAAGAIAQGQADLICLGRGLIAEPDWPDKVRTGRLGELRPCIACNACVDLVGRGERARCSVNPEAGRERTWSLEPTAAPRRVMIVGSGPAGLAAARIARERGHDVSLWERDGRLGGKLDVAGLAPSKSEVLRFRDYEATRVVELGVEIHTGIEVTPALVAAQTPDVVLIATGADAAVPPISGIAARHVHDALDLLRGDVAVGAGEQVAVIGGSATGCETAELLAAAGATVTLLEMRRGMGYGIEAITRRHLVRALRDAGVTLLTSAKVVAVERDRVLYEDADGVARVVTARHVALALGWRARGAALADALAAAGDLEVHVMGDAATPADFVAAVNAGADVGLAL